MSQGRAVAKMSQVCPSSILLWLALQIPCSLAAKLISVPLPRPDSEIKKRAPVPRLRGSDSEAQLSQLMCPLFYPVVTVLSQQCT